MELHLIKKMWQENEILKAKQSLTEDKVKEMIRYKGENALDKLIRYAKVFAIIMIPLGLFFCLCSYNFFVAGGYYMILPLLYLLICICIVPFEIYLYRLLKGIDFSTMPVTEVSEKILKYQRIIQQWQLYGTIFFIVYLSTWLFLDYKLLFGNEVLWGFIIYLAVLFVAGLIAIPILYKRMYYKNINQIKQNLQELELFEEGKFK